MNLDTTEDTAVSSLPVVADDRSERDAEFARGDIVGQFRIARHIQTGGFGAVYEASDMATGLPLALKILHADLIRSQSMKRFEYEGDILADIGHPNVVRLLDHGSLPDGRPFMAMELLSGIDLRRKLDRIGRFAAREIGAIVQPVCQALESAHSRGVIHRDIKPSNVFLTDEPTGQRVVLLDFGAAKLFRAKRITLSGQSVGTPSCMAPEQVGGRQIDQRTDVYGVGTLMFTMLTGRAPYQGDRVDVISQLLNAAAPRPRVSSFVSVPRKLDELVMRAMSREPSQRFASISELLTAFRAATAPASARARRFASSSPPEQRMVLKVNLRVEPNVMEDPDDTLLDDLESIVPRLAAEIAPTGFHLDAETGNSAIFSLSLPRARGDRDARRQVAINTVLNAFGALETREHADRRIGVQLMLDVDESGADDHADVFHKLFGTRKSAVIGTIAALRDTDLACRPTGLRRYFYLYTGAEDTSMDDATPPRKR